MFGIIKQLLDINKIFKINSRESMFSTIPPWFPSMQKSQIDNAPF